MSPLHTMRIPMTLGIVAILLLAGCLGAAVDDEEEVQVPSDGTDPFIDPGSDGNGTHQPGTGGGNGGSGGGWNGTGNETGNGNGSGTGNATGNGSAPEEHVWPALADATIRPGMRLYVERPGGDAGFCSANFVFRSPTNGSLYIGTAAHCMYQDVGAKVYTSPDLGYVTGGRGDPIGRVVYSSYKELGTEPDGNAHTEINDFALVAIDEAMVGKVHPAMLHYGGPTALAEVSDLAMLKKIIYFGNSPLRPGPDPVKWHEGYITAVQGSWSFSAYTVGPGIQGDSGSGVLLGDGKAAGITVALGIAPFPGESRMTTLTTALDFARESGWDVELQTWDLLNPGLVP